MPNVLVTGAAGFIGSHVCERLLSRGYQVVGIDNFDEFYPRIVKERNIKQFIHHSNCHFIEADIRNNEIIKKILKEYSIHTVIHLAARAGVRPSIQNPLLYVEVNINGTTILLESMKECDIKRLVFGSSSSVYGNQIKVPFSEDDPVDTPISPYAATKKAGELLCYNYHHLYGFHISCLRFFTVYGPRQRPEMAIHKFFRAIMTGNKIQVYGDGSTARDYTYIDDIVDGIEAALNKNDGFSIFNLGNSRPIPLRNLIRIIEVVTGRNANIESELMQQGDVNITYADISKARSMLLYSPKIDIEEGISRFYKWLQKNKKD